MFFATLGEASGWCGNSKGLVLHNSGFNLQLEAVIIWLVRTGTEVKDWRKGRLFLHQVAEQEKAATKHTTARDEGQ